MKALHLLILFFFICQLAFAQSDTVSIFHQSPNHTNAQTSGHFGTFKNVLSLNLFQAVRGGLLVNYERLIGQKGLALVLGTGFCSFDPLGQFYVKEFQYYYELNLRVVHREKSELLPIFDFATKYYFTKSAGTVYLNAGFTRIKNSVTLDFQYSPEYYANLDSKLKRLNYSSNELKFLIGFTNDNKKKFYHDFSLGFGYRFIEYDYLVPEKVKIYPNSSEFVYMLSKKTSTNQTPWLFMAWRMGVRF